MKVRVWMVATIMLLLSGLADAREKETASKRIYLNESAERIEVRVYDPKDTQDAVQNTQNSDAFGAIREFLGSQNKEAKTLKVVTFSFIRDTSLVVVPVMVNEQGPFRFLLDTGASNTILSKKVADRIKLGGGKPHLLTTAGGQVEVVLRNLRTLQVGEARLKDLQIAISDFSLLEELRVDGILGGDYLRRFKVSIDYEKQTVQLEGTRESSLLIA